MINKTSNLPNRSIAWLYVGVQALILALLIFYNANFNFKIIRLETIGIICLVIGLFGILLSAITIRSSLTALPLPKDNGKFSRTGLYKYVRHPMYTSVVLFSLGIAIYDGSIVKYILVICLCILFIYKSKYEEHYLRLKYPGYSDYAKNTPRFIPFTK